MHALRRSSSFIPALLLALMLASQGVVGASAVPEALAGGNAGQATPEPTPPTIDLAGEDDPPGPTSDVDRHDVRSCAYLRSFIPLQDVDPEFAVPPANPHEVDTEDWINFEEGEPCHRPGTAEPLPGPSR